MWKACASMCLIERKRGHLDNISIKKLKVTKHLIYVEASFSWIIEGEHPIKHLMLHINLISMICQFLQKNRYNKVIKGMRWSLNRWVFGYNSTIMTSFIMQQLLRLDPKLSKLISLRPVILVFFHFLIFFPYFDTKARENTNPKYNTA